MQINGAVALITGGASGLGLATAQAFIARGAHVILVDLSEAAGTQQANKLGPQATFAAADVRSEEDIRATLQIALQHGEIRIVVNCAGVATPGRTLGRNGPLPLSEFERVLGINLVGTFNVTRLAAEIMASNAPDDGDCGVIICTASVAAFDGQVGQAAYAASKAGIAGLTLPLARDLADRNIRVMSIAPGIFETPMMAGLPERARISLSQQTLHPQRLGKPEEYAALAVHIVENPMLNGETIRLDGGIRMTPK